MDYSKMTDEEFFTMIEKEYGEDWTPSDIKGNPELLEEYNRRISTGIA